MDKNSLSKVEHVYPLKTTPYKLYIDVENQTVIDKINGMIQNLHHIGRLTNDVVEQWNTVMEWVVNSGIEDITSSVLKEKLDVALNKDLRILTETVADEKIDELVESGQFEEKIETAIGSMHENIQGSLNGFAAQLAETAKESDLIIERERISNLTANAGDTDGNAELLDIRIGFDGITYPTAGDATRALGSYMTEENQTWGVN